VCELTWNTNTTEVEYSELQAATEDFADKFLIGNGALCAVYKAEIRGMACAIKVYAAESSTELDEAKQFAAEMELLSRVQHPNICRFYAR
jgi:serine/threonine protein kinase